MTITVLVKVTETTGGCAEEVVLGDVVGLGEGAAVLIQSQAVEMRAASPLQAETKVGRGPANKLVVKAPQNALAEESLAVFWRPRAQLSAHAAQADDTPRVATRARMLNRIVRVKRM